MGRMWLAFRRHISHIPRGVGYLHGSSLHGSYGDSTSSYSWGVAIGFDRNTLFVIREQLADPDGRFLFIKGKLFNMECTLANIYSPNRDPDRFLRKTLRKLSEFKEGKLIVAGDLNMCIDPRVDTTGSLPRLSAPRQNRIRKLLLEHQLVDVWRIRHPEARDYTFYSSVHGTFSRIDYVLIEHQLLPSLKETEIKTISFSDHAPVIVRLEVTSGPPTGRMWKLNDSLIQDSEVNRRIEQELEEFFLINDTSEISKGTLWETHKVYIRGILISIGAGKKKEKGEKRSISSVKRYMN